MDNLIDDMVRAARRCERAAKTFDDGPVAEMHKRVLEACQQVALASSESWLGYQSCVYTLGLRPKQAGEHFDPAWGAMGGAAGLISRSFGEWAEYTYEAVKDEILRRAGITDPAELQEPAKAIGEAFDKAKEDLIPTLDVILSTKEDAVVRDLRKQASELKSHFDRGDFIRLRAPKSFYTHDSLAASQGISAPPHIQVEAWAMHCGSYAQNAKKLAKIIRQAVRYLEQRMNMKGKTVAKTEGKIFIGHGRSPLWKDLKDFLHERLHLEHDEFNRESTAGLTTKERLEAMLDDACFAFLVMTAEDEHADGTKHARLNVVHEAGLFQGRLGFKRAIILLEEGCEEFSNVHGLTQVRFPKGNIKATWEDIRGVLEREKILKGLVLQET
jgi:predicted nucleotide-binding protein